MSLKTEIPLSKNKLLFGIIGSILFVILGAWLLINSDTLLNSSNSFIKNPTFAKIVGSSAILFFGATSIYAIKKLFDKTVGLTVDKQGITDNSNGSSIGLIEWNDITEIRVKQVMSTKFILIDVVDTEKYINKASNKLQARLMRTNMKMYGTPLSITSNTLKSNFSDLENLLKTSFKNKTI